MKCTAWGKSSSFCTWLLCVFTILSLNISIFSLFSLKQDTNATKSFSRGKSNVKLTRHDGQRWREAPWRRPVGLHNVFFCLSKMAKNEICSKVSKNLDTKVLQQSHSIQQYCNIAGDILVWDFLPPCLLFKTPRTQWFDNDLIARYFQFEYSEATELYRFFNKNHYIWALYKLYFNVI